SPRFVCSTTIGMRVLSSLFISFVPSVNYNFSTSALTGQWVNAVNRLMFGCGLFPVANRVSFCCEFDLSAVPGPNPAKAPPGLFLWGDWFLRRSFRFRLRSPGRLHRCFLFQKCNRGSESPSRPGQPDDAGPPVFLPSPHPAAGG